MLTSGRSGVPQEVGEHWLAPPESPRLSEGEVHLWCARMDSAPSMTERLRGTLSEDELERAARFRFERDRHRFVVRHGVLRWILSRYLEIAPHEICFQLTEFGKPELPVSSGRPPVFFNISHSDQLALFAVCPHAAVGVDIERIVPERADQRIAEQFFSDGEVAVLRDLAGADWQQGFFNCWTRKEAYIKARGEGLSFPLEAFCVSLRPEEPAALLSVRSAAEEVLRWAMVNVCTEEGYVAALVTEAYEGVGGPVRCWQWPGAGMGGS